MHPDLIWTVDVGFTTVRPVIPDQHTHQVTVMARGEIEAALVAYAMVYGHRGVTMVTRVTITGCVA